MDPTSVQETLQTIEKYFARWGSVGLITPAGWFGRPYDNQHQLTKAEVSGGELVLELDGQLRFTISGPVVAARAGNNLALTDFTEARWHWREYGGDRVHDEVFLDGTIEFVGLFQPDLTGGEL